MKFTKNSETLMMAFMDDFSSFLPKQRLYQQRRMDSLLKKFYNEITEADKQISLLWSQKKLKYRTHHISHFSLMPKSSLFNSNYVSAVNKTYIEEHTKGYLTYHTTLLDRKITIYFALMTKHDFHHIQYFHDHAKRMLMWLKIAISHSPPHCGRKLSIFCYLSPLLKKLPPHQYNIIGPEHCNSAVTTSCKENGEICIFRKEEFLKVFMHETFHIMGLDFSGMSADHLNNSIKGLFPIHSDYNLHEAYSEFWATIMNALFSAYFLIDDRRNNIDDFILYSDFCIQFEQIFSLFQCAKVLNFMGLKYTHLSGTDAISKSIRKYLYKENSNVFAYYIIKALLLYFCNNFMEWCKKHNHHILSFHKSRPNLERFFIFIKDHYRRQQFITDLDHGLKKLHRHKKADHSLLITTMRMTITELS